MALGLVAALIWASITTGQSSRAPTAGGAADRASLGDTPSMSMEYDYFTINGKSYPATDAIEVRQGELVRLRFLNHASNAGVEPGGLIVPIIVAGTGSAPAAGESGGAASPAASEPTHTMAPGMTDMPGMESMPDMGH